MQNIDWQKKEAQLKKILEKYRSKNGSYDCIVPDLEVKTLFFKLRYLKRNII